MSRRRVVIDGNRPEVWPLELLDRRCEEQGVEEPTCIPEQMQAQLLFLALDHKYLAARAALRAEAAA